MSWDHQRVPSGMSCKTIMDCGCRWGQRGALIMLGLRVGTRTWSLNCPRNKPAPLSPVLQTLLLSQPDSEGPGATPVLTPSLHHGLLCCSGHRHQDKTEEGLVLHQKLVRYRTSSARRARHPPPLLTHPTGATSGLSLEGRGQGWRGLLHISVPLPVPPFPCPASFPCPAVQPRSPPPCCCAPCCPHTGSPSGRGLTGL